MSGVAAIFGLVRIEHVLVLLALILGHLTIALIHGFVRRDNVLDTMLFKRKAAMDEGAAETEPEPLAEPSEPAPAP